MPSAAYRLAEACREKPQWMRRKLSEEAAEAMEKAPGLEKRLYIQRRPLEQRWLAVPPVARSGGNTA